MEAFLDNSGELMQSAVSPEERARLVEVKLSLLLSKASRSLLVVAVPQEPPSHCPKLSPGPRTLWISAGSSNQAAGHTDIVSFCLFVLLIL